jgi:Tfp pilus assembly protein PilX
MSAAMTKKQMHGRRAQPAGKHERGVALIMALVILMVLSAMAAGIMFSTQTEIWASSGYKGAEQARYISEAGAQRAADWLQNTYGTTSAVTTDLANASQYNLTKYPVQYVPSSSCTGNPAGFTTNTNVACLSYYDSTGNLACSSGTKCFNTAVTLPSDFNLPNASVNVAAQLVQAQQVGSTWNLTWKIDSRGTVGVVKPATAQVTEIFFQQITSGSPSTAPSFKYGVFATGSNCGTISMSGGQYTNSYNSHGTGNAGNNNPTTSLSGGDVATFGNISLTNGAYIYGNVYAPGYNVINNSAQVPRAGVSGGGAWPYYDASQACSAATKYAVNEDNSGSAVGCNGGTGSSHCSDTASALPVNITSTYYANPIMPSVAANTSTCTGYNGLCNGGSGGGSGCSITIPPSTLPNGQTGGGAQNYGQVNFGSCAVITLQAGTYNMDTLLISNGAQVIVPTSGSVVINILNASGSSTPLNVNGGTVSNGGGDPNNLSIAYAGNKTVNLAAGANMFATIYAPNAPITVSGNAGLYGAVVGNTVSFAGSGHVVYDTHLASVSTDIPTSTNTAPTGPVHLDQFSWTMNYTPQE